MKFAAIIVAAGRGLRFGRPKQLVSLAGRPLIAWSLGTFAEIDEIDDLVIATERDYLESMRALAATYAPRLRAHVVPGGATRQASARAALAEVPSTCDAALIHDGARPLVIADDIRAGMAATAPGIGALIAAPVVDTVKVARPGTRIVERTLDRTTLWAAQTPQFGTIADLRAAHDAAVARGRDVTDDATLLEELGCRVEFIAASGPNMKVTHPADITLAESILRARLTHAE